MQRAFLTPASPSVHQSSFSFVCFQGKFLAFYQYAKSFNSDDFDYEELKNGDYVFMRWKVRSQPSQSLCCMQCPLCSPGPVLITACLLVVPLHAFKKRARLQAPLASCCHASRFVFGDTVWWFTDEFVAGGWQWSPSARLTVQVESPPVFCGLRGAPKSVPIISYSEPRTRARDCSLTTS